MPYTYVTYATARSMLAERLYDPTKVFWLDAELKLYLTEALRTWNALTGFWVGDYTIPVDNTFPSWLPLDGTNVIVAASPRAYTLTDTNLYSIIIYHLIEPQMVANAWVGTTQFNRDDLTQAYERRQNEILTITSAHVTNPASIVLPVNTRSIVLADTILDVRRARYVPVVQPPKPLTLWRGDPTSFAAFSPAYRQTPQNPRNYALSDTPPLELDVDFPPAAPGSLDLLTTIACTPPNLPANPVTLNIPNDWSWVLKWGMLMDLMNKQGEAQDTARAQYATTRYGEGLELMQMCPWLLGAEFNNVPVGIESVMERDTYDPGWETNSVVRKGIVVGGLDLISLCPRPTGATITGLDLSLVINAPVPVADGDFVQVPRDVFDVILDYSVHLAMFKSGGKEFEDTIPLFDNFRTAAQLVNKRIASLGLYDDVAKKYGKRQEQLDPRYA